MKKITLRTLVGAATLMLLMSGASAQNVIGLDFEGVGHNVPVLDFYNGGTDGAGNPGTNFGASFESDSLALVSFGAGQNGNFENEPSPDTVLYFNNPVGAAILNFAAGFDVGFSFFYSSRGPATVTVWEQIGGSAGNPGSDALATIELFENWQTGCVPSMVGLTDFCNWDPIGEAFGGIARSIEFGGTALLTGFDNVTFGAIDPVPLPAGVWLLGSGLLGFAAFRRRRACAQ